MKAVILIGGESRRMGQEKASTNYKNKTLLHHSIQLAKAVSQEFYLSVSEKQFEKLGHKYRCIIDQPPQKGPLGGVFSTLNYLREDIMVLAVDMPLLQIDTIKQLSSYESASYFKLEERVQSLPSKWLFKDLAVIKNRLENDQLSLHQCLREIAISVPFKGDEAEFKNMNSPEDLK